MRYRIFIIFMLFFYLLDGQDFYSFFRDETLRMDYFHTGNDSTENIQFKTFKSEPFYSGPVDRLIDPFNFGAYKVEVFNFITGDLIFSRGYSALFTEWQYTPEADSITKTFEETVVMPFPVVKVRIDISSRGRSHAFHKIFSTSFNPSTDTVMAFKKIYRTTNVLTGNGINLIKKNYHLELDIVFIPDGYRPQDSAKLYRDLKVFSNGLLECNPYSNYRNSIEFWVVDAFSQDSGTDVPARKIYKNTLVNTSFNTFNTERYMMTEDYHHVRDIAAHAPYDQIYIIVNTNIYGGGGIYNFCSVCVSDDPYSTYIFNHEFGHTFAGLGDEYYDADISTRQIYTHDYEPWEPNLTTLKSFSQKWEDMVREDIPIPTPDTDKYRNSVGAFEGGGYQVKGVYRPYPDCSMRSLKKCSFCPVCTRAISRMLDFYTSK